MTLRRLSILQWFGVLGGGLVWAAQHVVGYGIGQARCSVAGAHWGIGYDVWQLTLLAVGGLVVLGAEAAAVLVFVRTREVGDDDAPPPGRMHFFATAALAANAIFLTAMLLDGVASSFATLCRQG